MCSSERLDDLLELEAGRAGDLRAKSATARADYERDKTRRAVPRWMTSDGEAIFGVQAKEAEGRAGGPAGLGRHA